MRTTIHLKNFPSIAEALEKASSDDSQERESGKKAKATSPPGSGEDEVQTSKKSKLDKEATEVETILSGKVLDTHIPGLDEYMSHECK